MREDNITGALVGLTGACSSNPKTENTDRLLIRSLAFLENPPEEEEALQRMVDEIHAEKQLIAPGCAQCASPCGNTSDFDMRLLDEEPEKTRALKRRLISCIAAIAARTERAGQDGDCTLFYKVLSYIRYDLPESSLKELLEEAESIQRQIF